MYLGEAMIRDKLMNARCRLMIKSPWYGSFCINMTWLKSEMEWLSTEKKTMGVRIVNGSDVQCLYYEPFVDSLSVEELCGVIQHEIEHIVRCHCIRVGSRDKELANIAADMAVNGKRSSPRIGYADNMNNLILPMGGNIVWVPESLPDDETLEYYYEILDTHGSSGMTKDDHGFMSFDDHSIWDQTDLSSDDVRQVVKALVDDVSSRNPGSIPGHLVEHINSLSNPIIRWRDFFKNIVNRYVGMKRKTFSKLNRTRQVFGVPGVTKRAGAKINVIVDVSFSVDYDMLKQFFAEIESMSCNSKIYVLQWDCKYVSYNLYRKGDWKNIDVGGRGGTDMGAPIKYLIENRLVGDLQILLTDGFCTYSDDCGINLITVITRNYSNKPSWGHVIEMAI